MCAKGSETFDLSSWPSPLDSYPPDRLDRLVQVCEQLYSLNRRQSDVAKALGISAAAVSRMKNEATRLGIVRTIVCPPVQVDLSRELERLMAPFGIDAVIVCRGYPGLAAARLLEQLALKSATFVLDGGRTVRECVESFEAHGMHELTLVPLCADPASYDLSAYNLMTRLAARFPAVASCIKMPYSSTSLLAHERDRACYMARGASVILLGVGPWTHGFTALEFVRHLGIEPKAFRGQYRQVVAMCGYCGLDARASFVRMPELDVMPRSLTFEQLRESAVGRRCRVVLMAGGESKVRAVATAIRARVCNVLVVDRLLGVGLVSVFGKGKTGGKGQR